MYENDDFYEDEEERAFRDYAFELQNYNIVTADTLTLRRTKSNWTIILKKFTNSIVPKNFKDKSFGFEV